MTLIIDKPTVEQVLTAPAVIDALENVGRGGVAGQFATVFAPCATGGLNAYPCLDCWPDDVESA